MYNGEVWKKIVKHPFFKQAKPLALMCKSFIVHVDLPNS
jgi:hypothetical protein